jgi:hypothetical protein
VWLVLFVLLAVLLVCAGGRAGAQAASGAAGSLTGKLTDLHSAPLDGATVVVRNEATGAEARGTTGKNGSFRFGGLEAGVYTVEAVSARLGRGRLEDVLVSAGHEARVQAAMAFEAVAGPPARDVADATEPAAASASRGLNPGADTTLAPVVAALPAAENENARTGCINAARRAQNIPQGLKPETSGSFCGTAEAVPFQNTVYSSVSRGAGDGAGVVDPLLELAVAERRAAELTRERPSTEAEAVDDPLAAEAALGMALSGRAFPSAVRVMPETSAQVLTATLVVEPLLSLNMNRSPGRTFSDTGNTEQVTGLNAEGVAADAAVVAVRAAIVVIRPGVRPVLAAAERVDPGTAAETTTVTATELQVLPAAGRRWQDFELDTPTASSAAGGSSQISLRGADSLPAESSLDGASTRMAFGGQGAGPQSSGPGVNGQGGSEQNGMGQAWAGGRGSPVAEAAIREVQTAAGNAEAQGVRAAGGRVNVETARGTNGLHGQGFVFDRQNTWGAQNPFTQWVKETAPATASTTPVFTSESYTPPDHESVWGIGVGSQIRRDKLFWFGALDSYNRNDPGLSTVKHPEEFFAQPSNDQMQVLSARLGLSAVNPIDEGLGQFWQELTTLDVLLGPAHRTAAQWVGFARLDWQAAERHRFTLEGTGARWNSPGGGLTRVSENYGTNSFGSSKASEELLLGRWEAFLTPNLLALSQGSAGRSILAAHAETPSAFEQSFLAPSVWGQLPQMVVDSRYGFTIGNPSRFGAGTYPDEHVYQAQETVDWVRGNLLVKGGFQLMHNADATSLLRNQTGTYNYSSVENFASDALVFAKYGLQNPNDVDTQHGCDDTGKAWRDSGGNLRGLGNLPCYSYYSQTMGPTNWNLSTNDWAGFVTTQWQPRKLLVIAGGLRWEREQLPPPIAAMVNPELALTERLPSLGNDWGPRISMALGSLENHRPVLRVGYGMYFGRTENATVETALTQTGNLKGDLNFFMRPTDDCQFCAGGAPPFPYVLSGEPASVVKPGAVEFASTFRNPEVHQAVAAVEEELPGHVKVTASAEVSLGRRLPISMDTNFDPAVNPQTITYAVVNCPQTFEGAAVTCTGTGPIKTPTIMVPFYASWPATHSSTGFAGRLNSDYQQISEIMSRANSTYEAAVLKVDRYGRRGLSLHAHYTYSHAMDWNPNESTLVAGSDVLDPAEFGQEYGTSDLDVRHSATILAVIESPWRVHGRVAQIANGWTVSVVGQFRSGLPYTMRTSGSLAEEIDQATGAAIVALGPGMNGSGGDNRVYGVGRNTFRYPATWKADLRAGKKFDLGRMRELELLVESFNLFNHQNVTEIETTGYSINSGTATSLPTLNFLNSFTTQPPLSGLIPKAAFGQPLNINATNSYRERQIQAGVRMRF